MPRVPRANVAAGRIPFTSPTSVGATLATFGALANVVDQQIAISQKFDAERLAQTKKFEAQRKSQRDTEEFDNAVAGFTKDINDISQEAVRGDDVGSITSTFDTRVSETFEARLEQFESEEARERFRSSATRLITAHRVTVDVGQFKREQSAGRADLQRNLDDLGDAIITAPSDAVEEQLVSTAIASLRNSKLLLSEEVEPAIEAFLSDLDVKRIEALVELADASDTEEEAAGHLGAASDVLADTENNLSPKQRTSLRGVVDSQSKETIAKFNVGRSLDLSRDIASAETLEDFGSASLRIDKLLRDGVITEGRAIDFSKALRSRAVRLADADNGAARIQFSVANGIPIDPSDQKSFDAFFEERFLKNLDAETAQELEDAIVDLVEATDMIPSLVESNLAAAANSDNPDIVDDASRQFVRLREASPQAVARIPDAIAVLLENVNESIQLGVSPKQALTTAREIAKLDPSIISGRGKDHTSQQRELSDGEWLSDNSGVFDIERSFNIREPFTSAFNSSAEITEPGLVEMFSAEVKRQFILDPRLDKARERALRKLQRVVGLTEVGGVERIAYLSPELMYPAFRNDSDAITKQLVSDIRGADIPDVKGFTSDQLSERLMLVADSDSIREFDPDRGVLTPGYQVYLRSGEDESDSQLLLMDSAGVPIRFTPDDGVSRKKFEADSAVQAQERVSQRQSRTVAAGDVRVALNIESRARSRERQSSELSINRSDPFRLPTSPVSIGKDTQP